MAEYVFVLIHLSVVEHLGCFHSLAIVKNAAGVQESVLYPYLHFLKYMPRSGIVGSYGSSIFSFLRTTILLSMVVIPVYIPTNSV
jgi:hypothetical protein